MLLAVHIIGAMATLGAGLFSRKILRLGVLFEVITGTLLAISQNSTLGSYCVKIGIYITLWLAIEGVHIIRSAQQARPRALSED